VQPGRTADHSPSSSAAVMEELNYISTHLLGHTGPVTGPLYLFFFKYFNLLTTELKVHSCNGIIYCLSRSAEGLYCNTAGMTPL